MVMVRDDDGRGDGDGGVTLSLGIVPSSAPVLFALLVAVAAAVGRAAAG